MSQKRLLRILLVVLGIALAYAWWQTPRQEQLPPSAMAGKSSGRAASGKAAAQAETGVRLDLLVRDPAPYPGFQRDLFSPLYAVTVAPPAPPPPPPPPPPVLPPPPPPIAPTAGLASATAELARFTFLGYLQKEGERTIFLTAADEIFLVKNGDSFGRSKQFQITELTADRLVIRQGEAPQPIVISLVEQASLAPARTPSTMPAGNRFRPGGAPAAPFSPPPPVAQEEESPAEAGSVPTAEPAPTSAPQGEGEGEPLLKPLPRSNFNNLFQ